MSVTGPYLVCIPTKQGGAIASEPSLWYVLKQEWCWSFQTTEQWTSGYDSKKKLTHSTNGFVFSDEGWNLKGMLKIVTARLEAEEKKNEMKWNYFLNITANKVKLFCSICKAGQGNQEDIHRSWLIAPMCNMSRSQRVATRKKLYKDVETLLIAPTQRLSHVEYV